MSGVNHSSDGSEPQQWKSSGKRERGVEGGE